MSISCTVVKPETTIHSSLCQEAGNACIFSYDVFYICSQCIKSEHQVNKQIKKEVFTSLCVIYCLFVTLSFFFFECCQGQMYINALLWPRFKVLSKRFIYTAEKQSLKSLVGKTAMATDSSQIHFRTNKDSTEYFTVELKYQPAYSSLFTLNRMFQLEVMWHIKTIHRQHELRTYLVGRWRTENANST